jgi:hypothetical protein
MCSDPYAKIFPLTNRSTDWQSGQPFDVQVNLLANGKIWHMDQPTGQPGYLGQPTGKVVSQCTKFTMLIPSTKLLVYTPSQPLNLFFLLPLRMPSPCHSRYTLFSNCCIGSLSCTQSTGPGVRFTKAISVWVVSGHKFPVMLISVAVH